MPGPIWGVGLGVPNQVARPAAAGAPERRVGVAPEPVIWSAGGHLVAAGDEGA